MDKEIGNQRITQKEKDADDKKYYRNQLDLLDGQGFQRSDAVSDISEYRKMKVNYDLFNNKLNVEDLAYVCKPFGAQSGELPAEMANRDIISGKIKAILGMEAKNPFGFQILAVNPEATTRKEQKEADLVKNFVLSVIMQPIQEGVEMKYQEQQAGKPLTEEQKEEIKKQIAEETKAMTPPQVRKYMAREHKDIAEALMNQILHYLLQKEKIKAKFLKGFQHGLTSGREVFMVGLNHNEPFLRVINSMHFDYAKTSDSEMIEDSAWGVVEFNLSPSELITMFRDELTDDEIDIIYDTYKAGSASQFWSEENLFRFDGSENSDRNSVRVLYGAWKSERKIGFLTFTGDDGTPQKMMVSDNYKFNPDMGDIDIDWQWIPEVHHGYKISCPEPIYVGMGAFPGQHRDLDTLHICKLPFYGTDYDDLNSETTSTIDRLKAFQYFYNVIIYRIELLMASDKGKILMMNLNAVPKSAGIDLKKFHYFMESNKIAWYNPAEEGNKKGLSDVNAIAKVLDMSLASDINQYIQMAEYIERRAGESIGVPKQMEAQISPDESVRNVQTTINASSNILEPLFQLHNAVKENVLQALVDIAKVGYAQGKPRKLAYFLDDQTQSLIDLNKDSMALLDASTLGLFMANSTKAAEAKRTVQELAHAAMQSQQVDILDIIKVIRAEGINEAEELLEDGIAKKAEKLQESQMAQIKANEENEKKARAHEQEKWAHEGAMIELKEKLQFKREMAKQTVLSLGFNEDKDMDKDGTPDVLEVAKFGVDADIKARDLDLKERKMEQDYELGKEKNEREKEKNKILKDKPVSTAK